MREIVNKKIKSTKIGFCGRGLFSSMINFDDQGFGGCLLYTSAEDKGNYAGHYMARILETVGVENWEDLKGQYVRVDRDWSRVYGIGHITEDKWFYHEELEGTFNE